MQRSPQERGTLLSEGVACKAYKGIFSKGARLGVEKHPSVAQSLSCAHYFLVDTRQSQDAFIHGQHFLGLLESRNTCARVL